MMRGRGNDILDSVFEELIEYTETHFKDEEQLLQVTQYAGLQGHIIEHQAFINRLSELHDKHHTGKTFLTVETLAFIRNWLNGHIKGTDKQYTQCLNDNGIF